jgi:hypothetical protein
MKVDEWHSLITIYIPIALLSLWGLAPCILLMRSVQQGLPVGHEHRTGDVGRWGSRGLGGSWSLSAHRHVAHMSYRYHTFINSCCCSSSSLPCLLSSPEHKVEPDPPGDESGIEIHCMTKQTSAAARNQESEQLTLENVTQI